MHCNHFFSIRYSLIYFVYIYIKKKNYILIKVKSVCFIMNHEKRKESRPRFLVFVSCLPRFLDACVTYCTKKMKHCHKKEQHNIYRYICIYILIYNVCVSAITISVCSWRFLNGDHCINRVIVMLYISVLLFFFLREWNIFVFVSEATRKMK